MKIAVVTPYFPLRDQPYRGHSAYQTLLRLKRWADVEALCPLTTYPSWFTPRNFPYSRTDLTYSPPGIRTTYFEYPALPGITRPLNGAICASYLEKRLEKLKADVILNYWIYPEGYAAVVAGNNLGIPVILGAIGSDLNRIPDSITRWNTQRALRRASFTITVSRHLRKQAISLGAPAEKVRAILNGCDTSIFYPADRGAARGAIGMEPDAKVLLYVGRLDLAKGLQELIEALAALRDSNAKLVFVGEGPARPMLEACASRLGVSGQIIFAGVCGSADVARWMAAADVFCLPSYAEGCPNVIVEALSCGRPVVATKVGGIPELIEDRCGILIPPQDSQALAVALKDVLSRDWDQDAIAAQYQRSWEQVAEETFEVCKTVCPVEKQEMRIDTPHLLRS